MSTTTVTSPETTTVTIPATSQPAPVDATGTNGGQQGSDKTFTQVDVDRILSQRESRDKKKLRDELEADIRKQVEDEQQRKTLEDQQQFKPLYEAEQRKAAEYALKAAQVEALQQAVDRHANAVDAMVTQQLTLVVEDKQALVEELFKDKEPVWKLDFLTAHPELFQAGASGPTSGISAAPRPAGPVNRDQLIAQEIEAQRSRRR